MLFNTNYVISWDYVLFGKKKIRARSNKNDL
jgi:hypothetical protein